jgi:hypothetical protein
MIRAAFLIYDSDGRVLQHTLRFQINPDTLTRTIQPQSVGGDSGDRLEALRFKGPPVETIKFKASFDTAQMLGDPEYPYAATQGLHPLLAAFEILVYPTGADLQQQHLLADLGTLELAPLAAPLILFSWGPRRLVPVRITDMSITETSFDQDLNPVLSEGMDLTLRVLSLNDLDFNSGAAAFFRSYQQGKEDLAKLVHYA